MRSEDFHGGPKNWCFWTVVLVKTLESPLDCKEIQLVHSKEDQSWVFFGRNDAKAETPILWPPHAKSWLIGKDSAAGRDWGQEEKWTTEDEMAGWHHRLDGREFGWTPGVGDGQGGLACCNSWGHRVRHNWATELNWNELIVVQWLRTRLAVQGIQVRSLVWETKSHMPCSNSSPHCNYWAPMLWSPQAKTRKHCSKKPFTTQWDPECGR